MPKEIERKFLVTDTRFLVGRRGDAIVQGYVAKEAGAMTTRVRIRGERAFLTLKGPIAGMVRDEFEYEIPLEDARKLLECHCGSRIIRKTRYLVEYAGQNFEVDVFNGRHAGLVIAELELAREDQIITLPPWVGEEVTYDRRFGNFALCQVEGPVRPSDWRQLSDRAGRPEMLS